MNVDPHQEDIFGKAYDLRLIKRLWQFMLPYKRLFFLSMLLLPIVVAELFRRQQLSEELEQI